MTELTRRGAIALGLGGAFAAAAPGAAQPRPDRRWSSLDTLAADAVAQRVTPGMQISAMKRGVLVYSRAFGAANLETGTPMTPVSVLRIGSLTKQFTAAAILLLQEDGRLSVDDRLARFVPELAPAPEITIRQMLNHVSGLSISPTDGPIARRGTVASEYDAESMVALIRSRNPVLRTPPGTHWEYNNLAYRLLGVVAERASGSRTRDLFRARLFDPARLPRTAMDDISEVVPGRASGYEAAPGPGRGFSNAVPVSMSWPGGAGAMRSTADDLCHWHDILLGGRLLRPESLSAMLTPVRLNDGTLPMARPPAVAPDTPLRTLRYGFGLRMEEEDGRQVVTHTGSIEGFVSELSSYPAERVSVAVLANSGLNDTGDSPNQRALHAALREAARIALS